MVIQNRKHWKEILGPFKDDIVKTLIQWRSDHTKYPHSWDLFSAAKLTQEARDTMSRILDEARVNGWYAPRVRDGVLFFSSLWPVERRASEGDWHSRWQQSQRQPGDDTQAEFVQEALI
jgi:hypothetical protein